MHTNSRWRAALRPRLRDLEAEAYVCVPLHNAEGRTGGLIAALYSHPSERTRRMARRRSLTVLASFTTTMLAAFVAPRLGFGLIWGALILHLQPESAPGSRS